MPADSIASKYFVWSNGSMTPSEGKDLIKAVTSCWV
jgi:hypothetical protein